MDQFAPALVAFVISIGALLNHIYTRLFVRGNLGFKKKYGSLLVSILFFIMGICSLIMSFF